MGVSSSRKVGRFDSLEGFRLLSRKRPEKLLFLSVLMELFSVETMEGFGPHLPRGDCIATVAVTSWWWGGGVVSILFSSDFFLVCFFSLVTELSILSRPV